MSEDKQCSSCGGFCKKSGCERENVKPEHEPVVWHEPGAYGNVTIYEKWAQENGWLPLYTTPQKKEWVGLTDEDISGCINSTASLVKGQFLVEFSKSIEAKLKEKNTWLTKK